MIWYLLAFSMDDRRSTNDGTDTNGESINPIQKEKKVEFQEMKWNGMKIESKEMRVRRTKSNIKIHSLTLHTNRPTDTHKQKLGLIYRCDGILFIFNNLSLSPSLSPPFVRSTISFKFKFKRHLHFLISK